jgi:hypothetical protein
MDGACAAAAERNGARQLCQQDRRNAQPGTQTSPAPRDVSTLASHPARACYGGDPQVPRPKDPDEPMARHAEMPAPWGIAGLLDGLLPAVPHNYEDGRVKRAGCSRDTPSRNATVSTVLPSIVAVG